MDTCSYPVRYLLAKQLFNITLSGIGRVFIYAAHLDVELQHIQNVMYHSSMEMPKIAIWEVEKVLCEASEIHLCYRQEEDGRLQGLQ